MAWAVPAAGETGAAPVAAVLQGAPSLSLVPQSGPPGTTITLNGSNYTPGGYGGTVRWDGVNQFTFFIPQGGSFQVQLTVPAQAAPGPHTVTVCAFCGQFEFEQTADAVFNVQAPATATTSPKPPTIESFTLDAGTITAGNCTNARWTTTNGVNAQLTGDFGTIPVDLNGSWQLCPPATQLYRLVVNGSPQAKPNSAAAEITLIVIAPATATLTAATPPTLTPPPTATRTPTPVPPTATPATAGGPCAGVPAGAAVVNFDAGFHFQRLDSYRDEAANREVVWHPEMEIRGDSGATQPPRSAPNWAQARRVPVFMRPNGGYWTTAGLFLGLPNDIGSAMTVTLRGYDASSTEVVSATATLGPSAAPFETCLMLAAPQITRVTMSATGGLNIRFDDFFFIARPWPTCPGTVAFTSPAGDTDLGVSSGYTLRGTFSASARPLTFSLDGDFWDTRPGESSSGNRIVVVPDPADPNRFTFELTHATRFVGTYDRDIQAALYSSACANSPIAEASLNLRYRVEAELDVQVQAVEVTQGLRGDIPARGPDGDLVFRPETWIHVANRRTVVRVYPLLATRGGEVFRIPLNARLHGQRDGAVLPGSPLAPVRGPIEFDPRWTLAEMRGNAALSFNFMLPASWTRAGDLALTIELEPPEDEHFVCPACAETSVAYLSGVHFRQIQARAARVRMYLADFYWMEDGAVRHAAPNFLEIAQAFSWWKQTWPVADGTFRLSFRSIRMSQTECQTFFSIFGSIELCLPTVPGIPGWDNAIFHRDSADIMPAPGVTDPYTFIPLLFSPSSPIGCSGAAGIGGPPLFHAGACGPTVAQEAAHSIGLNHASNAHGELAGGPVDPAYPGAHGEIEANAYGFDILAMRAIRPTGSGHTHDFMSYGGSPQWVSLYTWLALGRAYGSDLSGRGAAPARGLTLISAPWSNPAAYRQTGGEAPAIYGQIDPLGQVRLFGPPFLSQVLPETAAAGASGYRLELRDAAGQALAAVPIEPRDVTHAPAGTYSFHATLPSLPGVAGVVVVRDQTDLGGYAVSANPPQVQLLEPAAGAQWPASGETTLRWQGEDPDGDPLYYQLEMSSDGGQHWTVLASSLQGNEFVLDLATMPAGGEGWQVRVQASDGYHTAVDQVGPISVAPKGPQAIILEPLDGATWGPGQALSLTGQAFDWMEGDVPAEALAWLADGEPIGQGESLLLPELALGDHQLTLRATNAQGLTGEHTITVHVAQDTDGDGLPDVWETAHALDPNDGSDAEGDADADVLPNWQEFQLGTDPRAEDTDADTYSDDEEVSRGSDPADAQSIPYDPAPIPVVTVVPAGASPLPASPVPVSQPTPVPNVDRPPSLAPLLGVGLCSLLGLLVLGGIGVLALRQRKSGL